MLDLPPKTSLSSRVHPSPSPPRSCFWVPAYSVSQEPSREGFSLSKKRQPIKVIAPPCRPVEVRLSFVGDAKFPPGQDTLSFTENGNDPPKRVIGLALASALVPRCLSWFLQGYAAFQWVSPLGPQVGVEEAAGFAGWWRGSSLRHCLCRDRSYGLYPCSGRSCRSGVWGHGRYPYGSPRKTTNTARNYRAQWQRPRGRLSAVKIQQQIRQ